MPATTSTRRRRYIETHSLEWRDYAITVTFERDWLFGPSIGQVAHVTLEERDRRPLPVTGTGFRSIFTAPEAVDNAGGPVAFVRDGLDEAAKAEARRAAEAKRRQLSLF